MAGYPESKTRQLYGEILDRVRNLTGVESASIAATVPLGDRSFGDGVQRAGSPLPPPRDAASPAEGQAIGANYNVISPDYFRTLGVALQRGREFEVREFSVTNLPRVAVINTALAERLWPGEDALGRRIQFASQGHSGDGPGTFLGSGEQAGQTIEVVGVVGSFRSNLNDHEPAPMAFVPYAQAHDYWASMNLHVRVAPIADEATVMRAVREEVRRVDPLLPVLAAKTLRYHLATNIQVWVIRAGAGLFVALGALAVLLAVVGVYGVKAYAVARRTREIGIRMALGASREAVLRQILGEGAKLTSVGLGLGLLVAAGAARAMGGFLFEVQPFDPLVFIAAPVLLSVPALVACWLPARRAARVDPMEALRSE
jgi:predicted permease